MTQVKDRAPAAGGMPLGGIGAGGFVLGRDGCFRDITVNNNRAPLGAIAEAPHAFLAIRVATADESWVRLLRTVPVAGVPLPALAATEVACRMRYPRMDFRLRDEGCPARVLWSAFSPVIPYDCEAASMPVAFLGVQFTNLSDRPLEVSALMSWENLVGRTATRTPEEPGTVRPITLAMSDEQDKLLRELRQQARAAKGDTESAEAKGGHTVFNGLEYATRGAIRHNADGGHCLAARWSGQEAIGALLWDPRNPEDGARLAELFQAGGAFPNGPLREGGEARAGALCCRYTVPPRGEVRADFAVSWYCPRYVVGGVEQGNGYTAHFDNATETALHGLRNLKYFILSTNAWHQGLEASSLPGWLKEGLVRSCMPLAQHGVHTRDEGYGQVESLAGRRVGPLEEHWNVSLAAMLLYPRFEVYWLAQYAAAQAPDGISFARYLGVDTLYVPDFSGSDELRVLHTAIFVLCVCRDYLCTGNIIPLQKGYPRIRQAISDMLQHDSDRDALPAPAGPIRCGNREARALGSPTASLWVAALHALAEAMATSGKEADGRFVRSLAERSVAAFEALYWNEADGYYRLYPEEGAEPGAALPPGVCHCGQIAGQWVTRFLGLGSLLDERRVGRALDSMVARNGADGQLREAVLPDGTAVAEDLAGLAQALPLGCLLICEGRAGAGLALLEQAFRREALAVGRGGMQAAWYVYYALAGVVLHVPRQHLRIGPNLPEGTLSLRVPLVTSWCLGEMRYERAWRGRTCRERVQLGFDSPITLREIEVRMPAGLRKVTGRCDGAGDRVEAAIVVTGERRFTSVRIRPDRPLTVQRELHIELRGEGDPPA